ncbi:MAG TPA: hypothetical protein VMZ91_05565 [Candidatus Paceibacterota bacterium]|nr:hypothetical protein [Candidatus Paceibacterota bacterium]
MEDCKKAEIGNLVVISPKVSEKVMFNYSSISDLPDLIKFVGKPPVIHPDLSLHFRKAVVKEGDYIESNVYGEVVNVLSEEIISKSFVLKARKPFSSEYANKVIEKPARKK